jgi:hypothetical protein
LIIASGVLPSEALAAHPMIFFTYIKRAKKVKEDLDSIVTPIGREFILIKIE